VFGLEVRLRQRDSDRAVARRGASAPGKLTDFVVVTADPLKSAVEKIRDIKVVHRLSPHDRKPNRNRSGLAAAWRGVGRG